MALWGHPETPTGLEELDASGHTTQRLYSDVILALTRHGPIDLQAASRDSPPDGHWHELQELPFSGEGDVSGTDDSLEMLPNLRVLTVSCPQHESPYCSDADWEAQVVCMLRSRWKTRTSTSQFPDWDARLVSLERINLRLDYTPSMDTMKVLKELADEGLWVTLLVNDKPFVLNFK